MITKIYSIYDSKAEAYSTPFFVPTRGLATRSLMDAVNNPSTDIAKYPADYTLFELGEYDDQNAQFSMLKTPVSCGVAIEFKNSVN